MVLITKFMNLQSYQFFKKENKVNSLEEVVNNFSKKILQINKLNNLEAKQELHVLKDSSAFLYEDFAEIRRDEKGFIAVIEELFYKYFPKSSFAIKAKQKDINLKNAILQLKREIESKLEQRDLGSQKRKQWNKVDIKPVLNGMEKYTDNISRDRFAIESATEIKKWLDCEPEDLTSAIMDSLKMMTNKYRSDQIDDEFWRIHLLKAMCLFGKDKLSDVDLGKFVSLERININPPIRYLPLVINDINTDALWLAGPETRQTWSAAAKHIKDDPDYSEIHPYVDNESFAAKSTECIRKWLTEEFPVVGEEIFKGIETVMPKSFMPEDLIGGELGEKLLLGMLVSSTKNLTDSELSKLKIKVENWFSLSSNTLADERWDYEARERWYVQTQYIANLKHQMDLADELGKSQEIA